MPAVAMQTSPLFPTQPARGAFLWRHHFQLKKRTIIPFKNFCLTTAARGMGAVQPRTQHGPLEFLLEMPICFLATLSSGLLPPSRFVCNPVGDLGDEKTIGISEKWVWGIAIGWLSTWGALLAFVDRIGCTYLEFTVSIRSSQRLWKCGMTNLCSLSGMSKEVVNPD